VISVDAGLREKYKLDFDAVDPANFWYAHQCRQPMVRREEIDIYDVSPERLGYFDFVFCGSVLMHLTDPFRALRALRSVSRGQLIIATNALPHAEGQRATAEFVHPEVTFCFWVPTLECVRHWILAAGYAKAESRGYFSMLHRPGHHDVLHGLVHAWV
jgi:tRNA (mo5U34)-methyltransferase